MVFQKREVSPAGKSTPCEEVTSVSEVKRKKNESFESFFRRVKTQWQKSGNQLQARKVQYFEPSKSRNIRRTVAIKRAKTTAKTDYLRKTGKLPPEETEFRRR